MTTYPVLINCMQKGNDIPLYWNNEGEGERGPVLSFTFYPRCHPQGTTSDYINPKVLNGRGVKVANNVGRGGKQLTFEIDDFIAAV